MQTRLSCCHIQQSVFLLKFKFYEQSTHSFFSLSFFVTTLLCVFIFLWVHVCVWERRRARGRGYERNWAQVIKLGIEQAPLWPEPCCWPINPNFFISLLPHSVSYFCITLPQCLAESIQGRKTLFRLIILEDLVHKYTWTDRPSWQWECGEQLSTAWQMRSQRERRGKDWVWPSKPTLPHHDLLSPVTPALSHHLGNKCSKHDPAGNPSDSICVSPAKYFFSWAFHWGSVLWGILWQALSHTSKVAWLFFVDIQGKVGLQLW